MFETAIAHSLTRFLGNIPDLFNSLRSDSLPEATSSLRIEPLVLVDNTLQGQEYLSPLMQTLTNIYSGYILQAFAISATIGNVSVARHLDRVQPNRKPLSSLAETLADAHAISLESYRYKLPNYDQSYNHGLEDASAPDEDKPVSKDNVSVKLVSKDNVVNLREIESLAVGKVLDVTIVSEDKTMVVPVTVRLAPAGVTPNVITTVFSLDSNKNTIKERYYRWRDGELSTINDMIFFNDMIDEHRKAMRMDKTGFYRKVLKARRNNRISALFSGTPSINSASNIAILNAHTLSGIEREMGGPIADASIRAGIFSTTSLMMLVSIDTEWERVVIYHRGIDIPTELNIKDLKAVAKGSGPDIGQILKDLSEAKSPAF